MNINPDKFRESFRRTAQDSQRFRITRISTEKISGLLHITYQETVRQRKITFKETKEISLYIEKCAKWLSSSGCKTGLMLYGMPGNGKTTMAKAICGLINTLCYPTKYIIQLSAMELSSIAKNDPARFEKIKTREMLFVDDWGCEPTIVKSWGNELSPITEVLYHRYDQQLFTIISSNMSEDNIKERYGLRIEDRMTEMFDKLSFEGESFRRS